MADQTSTTDHDPAIAAKLAARYEHMRAVTGPEPADLAGVARWLDGEASPEEAKAMEARVAGDAELGEAIARMRSTENVASLAAARAKRDTRRARNLWLGGGAVFAAAAVALVVASSQGTTPPERGPLGAGPAGARPRVSIVNHHIAATGASLLVVLRPGAAEVVANCAATAHVTCAFVLAIAGAVDAARASETLRNVLPDACELPPLDVLEARLEGATALTLTRL